MIKLAAWGLLMLALAGSGWSGERAPTGPEEAHGLCYLLKENRIATECDVST